MRVRLLVLQVRALCEKAKEILMEENNVQVSTLKSHRVSLEFTNLRFGGHSNYLFTINEVQGWEMSVGDIDECCH